MTETREAPEWPHRESTEPPYRLGSPMPCTTCDVPWPCPSQQWVDGLVAAGDALLMAGGSRNAGAAGPERDQRNRRNWYDAAVAWSKAKRGL